MNYHDTLNAATPHGLYPDDWGLSGRHTETEELKSVARCLYDKGYRISYKNGRKVWMLNGEKVHVDLIHTEAREYVDRLIQLRRQMFDHLQEDPCCKKYALWVEHFKAEKALRDNGIPTNGIECPHFLAYYAEPRGRFEDCSVDCLNNYKASYEALDDLLNTYSGYGWGGDSVKVAKMIVSHVATIRPLLVDC